MADNALSQQPAGASVAFGMWHRADGSERLADQQARLVLGQIRSDKGAALPAACTAACSEPASCKARAGPDGCKRAIKQACSDMQPVRLSP